MKILRIQGKNLASIAGDFDIDFTTEPLHSAGIFAICGPTGSGKSTILDAICLALFNNTPRTTGIEGTKMLDVGEEFIQQGDRRQILRRGCTEAIAAVEFLAIDGKLYRSVWRVWRANNKVNGKLQPADLRVYDLSTNTPITSGITEAENKLTQLIGLNYNQFTRTVLLAQNEFARFLKARKEEKAEVLEKLTGTEIYSIISNTVFTKTATIRSEWKELSNRIGTIRLLTEEEFNLLQKQQEDLVLQEKLLHQKHENLQHQIKWFEQLKQITTSYDEAQKQLKEALTLQNKVLPEAQWLQQLEKIESCRPLWQEKNECILQLNTQTISLQQAEHTYFTLAQKIEQLIQAANQQKILVNKYTTEYNNTKPEIINARRLDIEISNAQKAKQENLQALTTIHKKVLEQQTLQQNRNLLMLQLKEEQATLNSWFDKNGQHEQMCLNMSLIEGFLDTAHTLRLQISKQQSDLLILQQQEKEIQVLSTSQQLELNKFTQQYKTILQITQQHQELLNSIPIRQLRIHKDQLQIQREKLLQVITIFEKLDKNRKELFNRSNQQKEQQKHLEEIEQQISQYKKEIEIAGIKYNALRHSFEQARLAASSHITTLRNQLETNAPCPVCGSCQHPYSDGNGTVSSIFDSLHQETSRCEKEYDHLKTEHIRLEAEHKHLSESLQIIQRDNITMEKECEEMELQLSKIYSDQKPFLSTPLHALQEQLNQSLKELELIRQQEKEWEKHQLLLESNQKEAEKLKLQLEVLQTTLQDIQKKQIGITNEQSKLNSIIENLNSQKNETLNKVTPLISIEDWLQRWEKNYIDFKRELSAASAKWQIKTHQLEENKKRLVQLSAEYDENQKNVASFLKNEEEQTKVFHSRTEELLKLTQERKQVLQGQAADDTENYWQKLLEKTLHDQETVIQQRDQILTESEQLKGKITQIQALQDQYKERLEKVTLQLQEWLNIHNQTTENQLTEEELITFLQVTPEEIQQKRERQNRLRDQVIAAQATLREREKQQNLHYELPGHPDPATESSASLQVLYTALQQEIENVLRLKTETLAELHTQKSNRKEVETLKNELEEKAILLNQWSKLDELIGSQSGYKFKEIAQGYTLEILLSYANKQLRELTPRYQLQRIPDELALQVIDHDLCDEVRSVFSLSGGESFLVSLALALGLSSFSSRNHFEENLFIDEGFGTLDAETLQVVMEALERLRSQGRQVGIISHVEELTERIPAKICLVKTGNGKSKISIE